MLMRKVNYSANDIAEQINTGKMIFTNPIQRGLVWKRGAKSLLIHSLIVGYPVGTIYANRVNDSIPGIELYDVIDGQQRCTTTAAYLSDVFKLSDVPDILINGDEIINIGTLTFLEFPEEIKEIISDNIKINSDFQLVWYDNYPLEIKNKIIEHPNVMCISGLKFSELPVVVQSQILNYNFDLHYGRNMSQREIAVLFDRLNSGKPLTATEKSKAQVLSPIQLERLEKHPVFAKILSKDAIVRKASIPYVMQAYVTLFSENKSLLATSIRDLLRHSEITEEKEQQLSDCFNIFCAAYDQLTDIQVDKKIRRIFKAKSHFSSLIAITKYITENDIEIAKFVEWLRYFFATTEVGATTISAQYNSKLREATNSAVSVQIRVSEAMNSFIEFSK